MKNFRVSKNKNGEDVDTSSVPGLLAALVIRKKTRGSSLKGAKGPSTPVLYQGWIEKKGEKLNSDFKKRWAVVEEGVLWYYKERPTEEQFKVWSTSGGGTSPRRTGDAQRMSAPPEVKGGVKTLGFYLLMNCTMKHSPLSNIITLKGPLVDHKNDFSLVKKEIKIIEDDIEKWLSALSRAIVLQDSLADISSLPPRKGFELPKFSLFAGQILFFKQPQSYKMDVSEAATSFEAEDGIYGVAFLPCNISDLPIGVVDPLSSNPEVAYGHDMQYQVKIGFTAKVDGVNWDSMGWGALRWKGREYDVRNGMLHFTLRHSESGEEGGSSTGSHRLLIDLESEHGYEKKAITLSLSMYASCRKDASNREKFRWRRHDLAVGECRVVLDSNLGGNRYLEYGGERRTENGVEDDVEDAPASDGSSYSPPQAARATGSTSKSSGSSSASAPKPSGSSPSKKPEVKKVEKKVEAKKPEPKKLSKCTQCAGTGQNKCDQCTSGTQSKCNHCKKTGRRGTCSWCKGKGER